MKSFFGVLIACLCLSVSAQDTTLFYPGWGKPGVLDFTSRTALKGQAYSRVQYHDNKPLLIKHYDEKNTLQGHLENQYDSLGNHLSTKQFDARGQLREELIFRNDAKEMELFHSIFGATFTPANSNFLIRREYNDFGRETRYEIIGVRGQILCSRTTDYREDRRKARELLRDELKNQILADRLYRYYDEENRTVLEEYDSQGKLKQRVVLFDHQDFIQN